MKENKLELGDSVNLDFKRHLWSVQAVSENFACLVQQIPFKDRGALQYTVLDWRKGIRGPCDLIGWGYGDGTYSREQCEEMLREFESRELEISHRNRLPIRINRVNGAEDFGRDA